MADEADPPPSSATVVVEAEHRNSSHGTPPFLEVWMFISKLQFYVLLAFTAVTLPLLFFGLRKLHSSLRRSHYYLFLFGICAANAVSLSTILFELLTNEWTPNMKGSLACKAVHFLSNSSACFSNWTFAVMFAQRFVILFFPLKHMMHTGVIGLLLDTRRLMWTVLILSILTQSWALFLISELKFNNHSTCGLSLTNSSAFLDDFDRSDEYREISKWISLLEATSTYLLPFLCTLVVDLGVLVWSQRVASGFTEAVAQMSGAPGKATAHVVLFRGISNGRPHFDHDGGIKIQSAESVRSCHKRRHRAIRRCLLMATIQVLINLPYYILQFFDEIYGLSSSTEWSVPYLYADAVLYLLYLCQYPIILIHIQFLVSDTRRSSNKAMACSNRNSSLNASYRKIGRTLSTDC